jgi:hypothetical protein
VAEQDVQRGPEEARVHRLQDEQVAREVGLESLEDSAALGAPYLVADLSESRFQRP